MIALMSYVKCSIFHKFHKFGALLCGKRRKLIDPPELCVSYEALKGPIREIDTTPSGRKYIKR
jgi:hypothetical protein